MHLLDFPNDMDSGTKTNLKYAWYVEIIDVDSLKDKPKIYFRAQAWAKCLELLYASLSWAWGLKLTNFKPEHELKKKFEPFPSLIFVLYLSE